MFGSTVSPDADAALHQLDPALDALGTLPLDSYSDSQILALWRELETRRHRLAPLDHALIAQVQSRQVAATVGERSATTLARRVLRVSASEAKTRITAAEALGPRRSLLGEPLEPIYPSLAAAQAAGAVSETAARVIVSTIEHLPDAARAECDRELEHDLTEHAKTLDLDQLRTLARHVTALLDPDGLLTLDAQRQRQRDLTLRLRPDGSSKLSGNCTAELTEWLRTVLDTLAKPKPAADGAKDPRTAGQRRHDALLDALKLTARAELLPDCGRITSTLLLTMTRDVGSGEHAAACASQCRLITVALMVYLTVGSSPAWMLLWIPADLVLIPLNVSIVALYMVTLLARYRSARSQKEPF